jgi:L-aspartate oxidase
LCVYVCVCVCVCLCLCLCVNMCFVQAMCLEASHNRARIIHWRDQTGLAITTAMLQAMASEPRISVLSSRSATDLLTDGCGRVVGARVFNALDSTEEVILSPHTVLATGGLGEVFKHTSNHVSARGDGLALAHRAGAQLQNMEYMQFHVSPPPRPIVHGV